MGQRRWTRNVLLACGVFALASLGATHAQEASDSAPGPLFELRGPSESAIDLDIRDDAVPRFAGDAPIEGYFAESPNRIELELAAGGGGAALDIAIAQRASLGSNAAGDINRRSSGAELRVGRGLVERREGSNSGSLYAFIASDDEALTWQPGARSEFGNPGGSVALQNQVQVGDHSAGVAYERSGVQASLAYVEREESTVVGQQSFSQDQSFAGVTVTIRR